MSQQSLLDPHDRIVDVDIADRMEASYLDYAMSVIVGRALPDVRDGLKPVQRRILYAMFEAGLRPDRQHRKSAAVIGDVMKKYHPHGDASIYDALVRMAQDFAIRDPLVDGRGNFGSIDGDPPAAIRYTECRLTPLAMALLDGIDEATVDFAPNYDGFETEPTVLPARVPNLLVNGATGIGVGIATNIPPHNLGEVIDACLLLIRKPAASIDDLMAVVPAPDFPTGARIVDTDGIRDAYLTGRGAVTMEAVAATEVRSGGMPRIVVTEIPYQVNKATLLEKMADLVKAKKLDAIRDLRDESSRDGMRIVIELKRGEDPAKILRRLSKLTDLRTNFNVNFVALVGGQPETLGLKDALEHYVGHQRDVLTRRTTFRRDKAAARAHVLEGLLIALDHLDEVIALIRAADTPEAARTQLMQRYAMSEVQATAVLDMQLRRLAALERAKIVDEHRALQELIAELEAVLGDPAKLDRLLVTELADLKATHATPRRSRLAEQRAPAADGTTAAPVLESQPVTVYVTAGGWVKAVAQRRTSAAHSHDRDPVVAVVRGSAEDTLLLVDAQGMGYRLSVGDVPVATMRQRGTTVAQLLGEGPDAPLVGAVRLDDAATVLTVSARGLCKRTEAAEFTGRTRWMIAAGVRDDDELVGVAVCDDGDHVLLGHSGGQVIRFPAEDVRVMGRSASGVTGMQVPGAHRVVAVSVLPGGGSDEDQLLTVGTDGTAKRVPLPEYPVQGRGGKGVQAGAEPLAWAGAAADVHVAGDDGWTVLRPETVTAGRRAATGQPVVGAVTGPVVPETLSRG